MSIMYDDNMEVIVKNNHEYNNKICYLPSKKHGILKFKINEVANISNKGTIINEIASVSVFLKKRNSFLTLIKRKYSKNIKLLKKIKSKTNITIDLNGSYFSEDFFSIFDPKDKIDTNLLSFNKKTVTNLKKEEKIKIENYLRQININHLVKFV